jgi:hypothetical protein
VPQQISLIIPPFTQLNTPYPSISYLAFFLGSEGIDVHQRDLSIDLALRVFSKKGLDVIFSEAEKKEALPDQAWEMITRKEGYIRSVDPVIRFLQNKDLSLAQRICSNSFLPQGPRVSQGIEQPLSQTSVTDQARYLCTLYLADIADFIKSCIDIGFDFGRYQSHLATGPIGLEPILKRLEESTVIDEWLDELVDEIQEEFIGITIPFPGTLYGALRIGKRLKEAGKTVWMGGGYVNTELRSIQDERFWLCCDQICLDDGETPLLSLISFYQGEGDTRHRTTSAQGEHHAKSPPSIDSYAPDYGNLDLSKYLQLIDGHNPTHRLWSDGRWNKLTLAHGCYWKKCAFCDIQLDYIARYRPTSTIRIVDAMERLSTETGYSGFHLVDEAAPPRLLKELALEILRRELVCSWWGNIRFEKAFTSDLCRLLAHAGMIAATGGLEVANDRLLAKMNKGVTLTQAVQSAQAFGEADIMVHAYLMYGFPTQTEEETLEAMEYVRQMFSLNILQSAFWHRFVLTQHSGVFASPEKYSVEIPTSTQGTFAHNDIPHLDPLGGDHDRFDTPLEQSLLYWMRKQHIEKPLQHWFSKKISKPQVSKKFIQKKMYETPSPLSPKDQILWIGSTPLLSEEGLHFSEFGTLPLNGEEQEWIFAILEAAHPKEPPLFLKDIVLIKDGMELLEALRPVGLLGI